MSVIAKRLEALLASNKWNEYDLERASGVHQPTIHRIISGESKSPRLPTLAKLAKALNVSVAYIMGTETEGTNTINSYEHLSPAALKLVNKIESLADKAISEDDYLLLNQMLNRLSKS